MKSTTDFFGEHKHYSMLFLHLKKLMKYSGPKDASFNASTKWLPAPNDPSDHQSGVLSRRFAQVRQQSRPAPPQSS